MKTSYMLSRMLSTEDTYKVNEIEDLVLRNLQSTGKKAKGESLIIPKHFSSSVSTVLLPLIHRLSVSSTVPDSQQNVNVEVPKFSWLKDTWCLSSLGNML